MGQCSFYNSTIFMTSLLGKWIAGWAIDSQFKRSAGICSCLLLLVGVMSAFEISVDAIRLTTNHSQLLCFAVIYGLGYGCSFTATTAKPAMLLGSMPEFSKLQSFIFA